MMFHIKVPHMFKHLNYLVAVLIILFFLMPSLNYHFPRGGSYSPSIDLYTQKGGEGLNQSSAGFRPGETVLLYANVTYANVAVEGKLVVFEVYDSTNTSVLIRSDETNQSGVATISFRIPQNGAPEHIIGMWHAIAVVSIIEETVVDQVSFYVSGPMIDVFTQRGGEGPDLPSDAFSPQEEIVFTVLVMYNYEYVGEKLVALEVVDSNNSFVASRTLETNVSGLASVTLRVPTDPAFGVWKAVATLEIAGYTVNDTVTFRVGWIIEIIEVSVADDKGVSKISFAKEEEINFFVKVRNIAFSSKIATLTISVFDECEVPIGFVVLKEWLISPDLNMMLITGFTIPVWAHSGTGIVYANAYTAEPFLNGTAFCPEVMISFLITG